MRLHSTHITALAVALGMGLAACGGDDSDPAVSADRETSSTAAPTTTVPPREAHAEAVASATAAFLDLLEPAQREAATYDVDDPFRRSGWSNLPDVVDRSGVKLADLTAEQRQAAMDVASAMLSDDGFDELVQIIAADDRIGEAAGPQENWGGDRYYLAVYGDPSPTGTWALQMSGHHFARTLSFDGGTVSTTPAFTGIEPRQLELDGTTVAPMADEVAAMFGLFDGLTAEQRAAADLGVAFDDVLLGPGDEALVPASPLGLPVADLPESHRALVVAAMGEWVLDIDETVGEDELATFEAALDDTHIAFSQSTDALAVGAYARIHGPRVWIEVVAQPSLPFVAEGDVHYHSVYRDLATDYGS